MMESTIFLDRKEYQDCLEVFEELWRGGEEPDLRFFCLRKARATRRPSGNS